MGVWGIRDKGGGMRIKCQRPMAREPSALGIRCMAGAPIKLTLGIRDKALGLRV